MRFAKQPNSLQIASHKQSLTVCCVLCHRLTVIKCTREQGLELASPDRRHMQHIFPELSPEKRDVIITRLCEDCQP